MRKRPMYRVAKRLFDIVVAAVALAALAGPLMLIALLVRLTSRGPAFYCQQRVGQGGKLFWLYKFRTMRLGSDGPQVTADGDSRITAVGRRLRRWKIDELPQLFNVLRGDMSIIGPRPEVPRFVQHYTPEQRLILQQKPGLAGLSALVYAHEADLLRGCDRPEEVYVNVLMPRKLAVDLEYENTRSFLSDLKLCLAIVLAILGHNPRLDQEVAGSLVQSPATAPTLP